MHNINHPRESQLPRSTLSRAIQLGIPTANLPVEGVPWLESAQSGVYFGWAGIQLPSSHPTHPSSSPHSDAFPRCDEQAIIPAEKRQAGWRLFPFVMSIGYNPFYKNTVRSAVRF
jgi:riboflavin kinase